MVNYKSGEYIVRKLTNCIDSQTYADISMKVEISLYINHVLKGCELVFKLEKPDNWVWVTKVSQT